MDPAEHWNRICTSCPAEQLGWYEAVPTPSLRLLDRCSLSLADPILDMGAGASTFVDCLLERGFHHIYAADISPVALEQIKNRLGAEKSTRVTWIVADAAHPVRLARLKNIGLWHDRALLHFLTLEPDRQAYRRLLLGALRPGGFVLLAAFAPSGASICSGLEVRRYSPEDLSDFLGSGFVLVESFEYLYTMPSGGLRPFTYTLFQKNAV